MTDKAKKNLINPTWAKHGYIQVYTGNGKGKTTASLGLAMRALGRNWKVLIIMFTKGGNDYGELKSFMNLSEDIKQNLKIIPAGLDRIVYSSNLSQSDFEEIKKGWNIAKDAILNDKFQLIILDEINIAIDLNIIDLKEVLEVLMQKPTDMEIVLTGRNAKPEIIKVADLVSKIEPVKHYWDKGIHARRGIEY